MTPCRGCAQPQTCRNFKRCLSPPPARPVVPAPADPDPIDGASLSREIRVIAGMAERVKSETGQELAGFEARLGTLERRLRDIERRLRDIERLLVV